MKSQCRFYYGLNQNALQFLEFRPEVQCFSPMIHIKDEWMYFSFLLICKDSDEMLTLQFVYFSRNWLEILSTWNTLWNPRSSWNDGWHQDPKEKNVCRKRSLITLWSLLICCQLLKACVVIYLTLKFNEPVGERKFLLKNSVLSLQL